jgi:putative ABC transport system substrate-binding protein
MNRRDTVLALAALGASPLLVSAQQAPRVVRIGYLSPASASGKLVQEVFDAFRAGLRDHGYVEGKNLQLEARYADEDSARLPVLAAELVGLKVDVIVTFGPGTPAAWSVTKTIPIVIASGSNPVAVGMAASLARPGGNVTGSIFFYFELMAKRLELLKEIKPSMTRVGVLLNANTPANPPLLAAMGVAAKVLNLELHPIEVRGPAEFDSAFSAWAKKKIQALVVSDNSLFTTNATAIAALAAKQRLPSIGPLELTESGGLMAYGVTWSEQFRRAAYFVDKILKGEKPGDLPIEQARKFDFVVNLKAAKALGVVMPKATLLRADRAIE